MVPELGSRHRTGMDPRFRCFVSSTPLASNQCTLGTDWTRAAKLLTSKQGVQAIGPDRSCLVGIVHQSDDQHTDPTAPLGPASVSPGATRPKDDPHEEPAPRAFDQ
jgi:hypothetical protein